MAQAQSTSPAIAKFLGGHQPYYFGRKVFAFSKWPDILGYCGGVLFPSIALNQIVELADAGLLFAPTYSCKQEFQAIVDKLNDLVSAYPKLHAGLAENSLSAIHASRDPNDNSKFFCHSISWSVKHGWRGEEVTFPNTSCVLFTLGTGRGNLNRTTRNIRMARARVQVAMSFTVFAIRLRILKIPTLVERHNLWLSIESQNHRQ